MSSTPPTPSTPETRPLLPTWVLVLCVLLPGLAFGLHVMSGDLLIPAAAIDDFHATLLQITAWRTGSQPILWDPTAILGGYPIYAASDGGAWYPGYLAFWLVNKPFLAWHITVIAHITITALLLLLALRPLRESSAALGALIFWMVMSSEAFLTLQTPATFFAMPWAVWVWIADTGSRRPTSLRIAHWMLCAGIAGLLGPAGFGVVAISAIGFTFIYRQWIPLLGLLGGALLAGHQLLPWVMQPEVQNWGALGGALLLATRPLALIGVILARSDRWRWWPAMLVLIGVVLACYPAGFAGPYLVIFALLFLLSQWIATPAKPFEMRFIGGMGGMSGAMVGSALALLSLNVWDLRHVVDGTRSLLPRESHPSIAVLQPIDIGIIPDNSRSQWSRYSIPSGYFTTAAGPLLWNLAPDPDLAAAAVALPWSPRWREQLGTLAVLHARPEEQKVSQLIHFEYVALGLGLNTLAGKYGDLPMLDYRRIDRKHLGQLPVPPNAPDAERDALQEQVLERLSAVEGEPEELPKPPEEWKQEPGYGGYFYQAKGNLPFAILANRPAKPLSLTPGPWPTLQAKALDKLQEDTPYPFFTSPTEKVRYLVLADDSPDGTVRTPATIVVDRGEAVDVAPKIERHSDGLTMHMRIPRTTSPWLILRQSLVHGWSCTVDDVAVPIARADGVWMAIPLPTDKDATIALTYTVPGLGIGRWLSAITALIWLVLGVLGMRAAGRFSSNAPSTARADATPPGD